MSLFNKIKSLLNKDEAETAISETTDKFSPEALDNPPTYTFIDALRAARQGEIKRIQEYLQFNKNYVYCKNWDDCTLLHEACRFARKDLVYLLLTAGAEINAVYKEKTPLHFAIEGDLKEIANRSAEQLLDYRKRRVETVQLLIAHHADLNFRNEEGEFPLHLAARLGYSELIALLLANHAVDVNATVESSDETTKTTNSGRTPLLLAARYNKHKKTFSLLLEKGADPNCKDLEPGYAPLHYIAAYRSTVQTLKENDLKELAELLITHGAEANIITDDQEQQTPLHFAVAYQHPLVVDVLLAHSADLHAQDAKGIMPIGLAARNGEAKMVDYLLQKGTDFYKSRVLFHAAYCRKTDAVLRLLLDKKGVDVNMPDPSGYTPIFSAISAHSVANVKLLVEKGINTDQHSPRGLTVSEHAFACWGEVECISGEAISAERRQNANDARAIVELLGGFNKPERKIYI